MPVPTWGGSIHSVRASAHWSLSWLSVQVCLPQGNYVNGNQTLAKQLEKTAFPAAMLWFQVSLPPTTSPHPTLLCSLWGLILPQLCRGETCKCKHSALPPPQLAFEKVIWWYLAKELTTAWQNWYPCMPTFARALKPRVPVLNDVCLSFLAKLSLSPPTNGI